MRMKDFIRSKERAWRRILLDDTGNLNKDAEIVLADLRNFCNLTKSNFRADALEMARMEGRRETAMRIMTFLEYDFSKIYDLEEESVDE